MTNELSPLLRAYVKAHDKSVVLDGKAIFPLLPSNVAEQLQPLIVEIENRAFAAGYRQAQENMRRAMGIRT